MFWLIVSVVGLVLSGVGSGILAWGLITLPPAGQPGMVIGGGRTFPDDHPRQRARRRLRLSYRLAVGMFIGGTLLQISGLAVPAVIDSSERRMRDLETRLNAAIADTSALRTQVAQIEIEKKAVPALVRANRFELVDAQGKTRASLRVDSGLNWAMLSLIDESGRYGATLLQGGLGPENAFIRFQWPGSTAVSSIKDLRPIELRYLGPPDSVVTP